MLRKISTTLVDDNTKSFSINCIGFIDMNRGCALDRDVLLKMPLKEDDEFTKGRIERLTDAGKQVVYNLSKVTGISWIHVYPYSMRLRREDICDWDELMPHVMGVLVEL